MEVSSNGVTRHYYLEGGKILAERTGTNNDIELNYDYDESGVCALWHGALYHVVERNHMGDVTALYRYNHDMISSLTRVAEYEYNATGEITRVRGWVRVSSGGIFGSPSYEWREGAAIPADHIAHANPWRWRGYYFDRETNL